MISAAGANLFGQWNLVEKVLKNFLKVSPHSSIFTSNDNNIKVIHISWSYILWKSDKHFYLTGSWLGKKDQIIEVEVPKEISSEPTSDLYLIGNDSKLILFSKKTNSFWVLNVELPFSWNWSHKKVPTCCENKPNFTGECQKRMKLGKYVVKSAVTYSSVFCLMSDGSLYEIPNQIDLTGCTGKAIDIACGYEHIIILTDAGHVYTWGNGRRCQLGQGNLLNKEDPTLVEGLAGIKINKIKAGGWHSLALSEFGDLYAWGWNDTGQLGIRNYDSETLSDGGLRSLSLPTIVEFLSEKDEALQYNVKDMACGSRHSAVILCDNTLWTTGLNSYGQLGHCSDTVPNLKYFKKCSADFCVNSSLLCGPWSTVIINPL